GSTGNRGVATGGGRARGRKFKSRAYLVPKGQGIAGRPGVAVQVGLLVADEFDVRPLRAPAPVRQPEVPGLALEVERIDEAELLGFAGELPGEVLGLPVEERAVVLAHVGAEEAVRAVGGGHGADPPQRR